MAPCYSLSGVVCEVGGGVEGYMSCYDGDTTSGGIDSATVAVIPDSVYECEGYRLPTEAEWEYAIRAGSLTALYTSEGNDGTISVSDCEWDGNLDQIGWYCGNSNTTHERGLKAPNDWGLYDMSGNVWEWVWDRYCGSYETYPGEDPLGDGAWCQSSYRVMRGGSWYDAQDCRSAKRHGYNTPGNRYFYLGFRLSSSSP